jgi:hypothetical protein
MKKVLATVAALGLVLGVTATAMALDQPGRTQEVEATTAPRVPVPTAPGVALWSVAGQWNLAGAYVSRGMGKPGGAAIQGSGGSTFSDSPDAWYIYNFKILPVLQVNDKIAVKGEIRFDDRTIFGTTKAVDAAERDADFKHVYMEWMSPWGKTRFGPFRPHPGRCMGLQVHQQLRPGRPSDDMAQHAAGKLGFFDFHPAFS